MDTLQTEIATFLARSALKKKKTTYPAVAEAIGWQHEHGRGLGSHLLEILKFCEQQNLPILTAILVPKGKPVPADDALQYIIEVFGEVDIKAEQKRVFNFNWRMAPELDLEEARYSDIDFNRLYASRVYGFDTDQCGMLGFGKEGNRNRVLEIMDGLPIYVVHFCSPNQQLDENSTPVIDPSYLGRVLGIAEVTPKSVSSETHILPELRKHSQAQWGKDKWPYGLEISRAWAFVHKPFTRVVLPETSKAGWDATNIAVTLTEDEKSALAQYYLEEVEVYQQERKIVRIRERDASVFTYLAVCRNTEAIEPTEAPTGHFLVKIGITSDPDRRLFELNGNHIAVIFDLGFEPFATKRWTSQRQAELVEALAHSWGHKHTIHASGEYFFMTESHYLEAAQIVMLGRE